MTEPEEKRRNKLLLLSRRRGTREMNLLLGGFADAHITGLTSKQLDEYELILEMGDLELLERLAGGVSGGVIGLVGEFSEAFAARKRSV